MDDFKELTEEEMAVIVRHSRELNDREPRIAHATYEASTNGSPSGRLIVELKGSALSGTFLSIAARELPRLENASDEQLEAFIVTTSGSSILWPDLDFGIGAPALAQLACGLLEPSRVEAARRMGSVRSEAKAAAVRANGAKGGRPRKNPVEA